MGVTRGLKVNGRSGSFKKSLAIHKQEVWRGRKVRELSGRSLRKGY
jgi:hypothetical protein